jgi:hypothetical protein
MNEFMSRRHALVLVAWFPAAVLAGAAGCSGGDPNQFVSGTMVKHLESVERAAEERGKAADAKARAKRAKKK